MRVISLFMAISLAALAGCSGSGENAVSSPEEYGIPNPEYATGKVTVINSEAEKLEFNVEIPLTSEAVSKGLMFRERLDDGEGMLFPFEEDVERSFWMKNVLIDLDMLFIGSDFQIKKIRNAVPCVEDPCPLYSSGVPVRYVLEIRGGLAEELNIAEGDSVEMDPAFSEPLNI